MQILAEAQQPLTAGPLPGTIGLVKLVNNAITHESYASVHGIQWKWQADILQQLLDFAVAAGLMRALPGDGASSAAVAYSRSLSSNSSSSSIAGFLCINIARTAEDMIAVAVSHPDYKGDSVSEFMTQEAVAEATLQLLATRCVLIHKQQQQQQQQGLLSRQLGQRMRGDLLLLPDPQQQLSQLLPSAIFVCKEVDYVSRFYGFGLSAPDQQNQIMLTKALQMVVV
jgi:hypothetical protein